MECNVARELSSLEQIAKMLHEFSERQGLSERDRFSLTLAIEEIVTNIIRHQPKNTTSIRVRIDGSPDRVVVTVVDPDSTFFDPTAAKDPKIDLPIDERKPGGLGIFLTKRLMDEMRYEFHEGTGTTTLVRRLEP